MIAARRVRSFDKYLFPQNSCRNNFFQLQIVALRLANFTRTVADLNGISEQAYWKAKEICDFEIILLGN